MNIKPHIAEWQDEDRPFSQPLLPSDTLQIRVNDRRFPFLSYVIPHLSYNCAILRRLKCSYMNLPVKYAQGYWHMDQQLVERWLELQTGLIAVINILNDQCNLILPLHYETYPLPSTYGFQTRRIREKQIRTAAMHAKAAFGPLVATCSYIISKTSKFTEPHARWQQCLIDNGVHPQWVEELTRSPITDFSQDAHRVGVIITPACEFPEVLPRLLLANVPTWILWDNQNDYADVKAIIPYRPTPARARFYQVPHHRRRVLRALASCPEKPGSFS
ncbi:hypothetical protein FIBSPDRAFT_970323 [Athelia psychrophila]|uniref:Uncharacterized protein n=1 Tax=Athelia psychrophila TaxID=1759441 RepID=A0A167SRR4_9AGAM|nr:hypothetical protein FIBSPDRAFT_970323 [Fibularhizoctonia sp. CBS 109695]